MQCAAPNGVTAMQTRRRQRRRRHDGTDGQELEVKAKLIGPPRYIAYIAFGVLGLARSTSLA